MGFCGESSTTIGLGFFMSICAFVLHVVGFATPFWIKVGSLHTGLWQVCTGSTCTSLASNGLTDQFKAAQSMECLALIALFVACLCILLRVFGKSHEASLYTFIVLCNSCAGITAVIGVIVFATLPGGDSSNLHFSFAFCCISAVGAFVAALMIKVGKN